MFQFKVAIYPCDNLMTIVVQNRFLCNFLKILAHYRIVGSTSLSNCLLSNCLAVLSSCLLSNCLLSSCLLSNCHSTAFTINFWIVILCSLRVELAISTKTRRNFISFSASCHSSKASNRFIRCVCFWMKNFVIYSRFIRELVMTSGYLNSSH